MIRGLLFVILLVTPLHITSAGDWTAWRGPQGNGISNEKNVPLTWSDTENVKWKAPLPGPGNSTPVVLGERVFVSCPKDDGRQRGLLCFHRADGRLLWEQYVPFEKKEVTHGTNPQCSSSPITDGERVYVWHGSAGLHVYDLEGKLLWSKDLGEFQHIWGTASSPVLHKNLVILNCGPGLSAFLIAFDKQSGELAWRKEVPDMASEKIEEYRGSWSTPLLHTSNGKTIMLVSLPLKLYALDPDTGDEIWSCGGLSKLLYTSPLATDEVAVAMSGYGGPAIAVKMGGKGDVTDTHRLWRHERNPQRVGSGVIVGEHIYIYNEPGIAWCLDLKTGEKKWEQRLGGAAWSSMVHVDGRLYVITMDSKTYVLEPNPAECKILAENSLARDTTRGSLAFSNGQIFIHTYKNLYCIENAKK
jgi:outer membrane protein assembly factor BamB